MALLGVPGIHPYAADHRAACLALFDDNRPEFFAPAERPEYAAFLDNLNCPYLVLHLADHGVVAAGGYYMTELPSLGALAWGMVARSWQRRGIGRKLLDVRVSHLQAAGAQAVRVRTSQRSRGFFERCGFRVMSVVPGGFAPGIDLVDLRLQLHGRLPDP